MSYPNLTAWERREEYEASQALVRDARAHHAEGMFALATIAKHGAAQSEALADLHEEYARTAALQIEARRAAARVQVEATERQTEAIRAMHEDIASGFDRLTDAVSFGLENLERTVEEGLDRIAMLMREQLERQTWSEEIRRFYQRKKSAFESIRDGEVDRALLFARDALCQRDGGSLVVAEIEDDPETNMLAAKLVVFGVASEGVIRDTRLDPFTLAERALRRGRRSELSSEKQAAADAAALLAMRSRGHGRFDEATELERFSLEHEQVDRLAAHARYLAGAVASHASDAVAMQTAACMVLHPRFATHWIASPSLLSRPDRTRQVLSLVRHHLQAAIGRAEERLVDQHALWNAVFLEIGPDLTTVVCDDASLVELAAIVRTLWSSLRAWDGRFHGHVLEELKRGLVDAESESSQLREVLSGSACAEAAEVSRWEERTRIGVLSFSKFGAYALGLGSLAFVSSCCCSWSVIPYRSGYLPILAQSLLYGALGAGAACVFVLGCLLVGHLLASGAVNDVRRRARDARRQPEARLGRINAVKATVEGALANLAAYLRTIGFPDEYVPSETFPSEHLLHARLEDVETPYATLATSRHVEPASQTWAAIGALRAVLDG